MTKTGVMTAEQYIQIQNSYCNNIHSIYVCTVYMIGEHKTLLSKTLKILPTPNTLMIFRQKLELLPQYMDVQVLYDYRYLQDLEGECWNIVIQKQSLLH